MRAAARGFRLDSIHALYPYQTEVALAVFGWPDLARDFVAGPQAKPPDLRLRDVYVSGALLPPVLSEKAITLAYYGQNTARLEITVLLGKGIKYPGHELLTLLNSPVFRQAHFTGEVIQLLIVQALQFSQIHFFLHNLKSSGYNFLETQFPIMLKTYGASLDYAWRLIAARLGRSSVLSGGVSLSLGTYLAQ